MALTKEKLKELFAAGEFDQYLPDPVVTWASITGKPTSMPASDVYAWAKAATKPSYTHTEVGAAASSHSHSGHDVKVLGNRLSVDSDGKVIVNSTSYRQAGMYGTFDAHKIGHIWSMGSGYAISATGEDFGNLYGLAYKYISNPTGGTMAGGHQVVWCVNGTPTAAMGTNIWTSGVFIGNLTGNAATATTASNSSKLGGLSLGSATAGSSPGANVVVRTDWEGYLNTSWINTVSGTATGTPTRIYCSQDAYLRYYAPDNATLRRSMKAYITYGTAAPSGGVDGDIYIQF